MELCKATGTGVRALVWILLMAAGSCQAEDLLGLYRAALKADPQLQSAIFDHSAGSEVITQAWADYRPTVTFDYDKVDTTQDIIRSDNLVFANGSTSFPTTSWSLSITQPIFNYAKIQRIGQAREEVKRVDAELVQAQQDLMLRLSEAYLACLAAEDELEFLRAERLAADQQLQLAAGREEAGIGRPVDRYDAEARLASVVADYAAAEVALRDAYEALYELVGHYPAGLASLKEDIQLQRPHPENDQYWADAAAQYNPALVVQRHAVNVARREVARQNGGHFPSVDVVLRSGSQDTGGTLFGGGSEVETRELMLRVSVPLYSGGAVSSKKRESWANFHSVEQQLTRLLLESRRQSKDAYWSVVNAIKRVQALNKAMAAQQATLELRRAAYESRLETAISVLDAERDLYSVKRNLAQAKYDYILNGLRLKALTGVLTKEELGQVNNWLDG